MNHLVLDTSYLDIHSICTGDRDLKFELKPRDDKFGSALSIELPTSLDKDQQILIHIKYSTTTKCTASQWLDPVYTISLMIKVNSF